MKRTITLCALVFFTSCAVFRAPDIHIGMEEATIKKSPYFQLYSLAKDHSVYKVGPGTNGIYRLFWFEQGKLVRMETFEPRPDLLIRHEKKMVE